MNTPNSATITARGTKFDMQDSVCYTQIKFIKNVPCHVQRSLKSVIKELPEQNLVLNLLLQISFFVMVYENWKKFILMLGCGQRCLVSRN